MRAYKAIGNSVVVQQITSNIFRYSILIEYQICIIQFVHLHFAKQWNEVYSIAKQWNEVYS